MTPSAHCHADEYPAVVCLGEVLVDFIQVEEPAAGQPGSAADSRTLFARAAGGAPANVAAALCTLDIPAAFVGKVGDDMHGQFLREQLAGQNVDLAGLACDPLNMTTLAFAALDAARGELSYSFARTPGADSTLRTDELDLELIARARVLHVGSFSLSKEPSRSATFAAIQAAHQAGRIVSCDANLRPLAWKTPAEMLSQTLALIKEVDALKVSEEEVRTLTGLDEVEPAARALLALGPKLVAVTQAERGATVVTATSSAASRAFPPRRHVDTAGAGDTFWAALLAWLLSDERHAAHPVEKPLDLEGFSPAELEECARFACAAASCSVEHSGAIGSAPTRTQVEERLSQ